MNALLFAQFAAHLLADFNFQSQKWCDTKDGKVISIVHFFHFLIVFVCSWIFSLSWTFGWAALAIAAFHFVFDVVKSYLLKKGINKNLLFFIDQILHFGSIFLVVYLFSKDRIVDFPFETKPMYFLFALLACAKPSNIFIKKYMEGNRIFPTQKNNNSLLNAGRIIGSLERLVSFVLIAFDQFAAVGFIIAAKSILRFKDTDTAKTEYLLIGSLLSFGIAILLGIIYQFIN